MDSLYCFIYTHREREREGEKKVIGSMFGQNLSTSYFVNIIKVHVQQIHLAALAHTFMQLLSP